MKVWDQPITAAFRFSVWPALRRLALSHLSAAPWSHGCCACSCWPWLARPACPMPFPQNNERTSRIQRPVNPIRWACGSVAAGLSFGHSHFVATEFLQIGDCRLAFYVSCRSCRSDSCWMLVASAFRNSYYTLPWPCAQEALRISHSEFPMFRFSRASVAAKFCRLGFLLYKQRSGPHHSPRENRWLGASGFHQPAPKVTVLHVVGCWSI